MKVKRILLPSRVILLRGLPSLPLANPTVLQMICHRRLFQKLAAILFIQAAILLSVSTLYAQSCPGGIELWRELKGDGELVIHCKRIEDLTADEWRNLAPTAVATLSREDRARLDARRKALGIVLVVSPSQNLTSDTRDFFERQVAMLDIKRQRAQQELAKVKSIGQSINQAANLNGRIISDLTIDSISHSLNVLNGLLLVYGKPIPAETKRAIEATISTLKFMTYSMATATAEADSPRQEEKLKKTLNALKNLLPASVVGINPQEWAAIKKATDAIPAMMNLLERIRNNPGDKNLWGELAANVDSVVEIAGSLPLAGPLAGTAIKAEHSAAMLLDTGVSLWLLSHDRNDLRTAGSGNQTAKLYWLARIGEIDQLLTVYKTSLAGTGELNLEDLP